MKVLQFQGQIPADGTLEVPRNIVAQIPGDDPVRVVLVIGESREDEDSRTLTTDRFLAGYLESNILI